MRFYLIILIIVSSCTSKEDRPDRIKLPEVIQALPDSIIQKDRIKNIVKEIADYNQFDEEFIGFGGAKSEQFKRFEVLQKLATRSELVKLVDHKNAAVKAYAFWALANRNEPDIRSIVLAHSNDTTPISHRSGCFVFTLGLNECFKMLLRRQSIAFVGLPCGCRCCVL